MTVRVAAVGTDGATTSTDTYKVTEWVGGGLPPHVANYQKGFFNRYMDPTENRANLDALAAEYPNLVTPVNLPNLTNGYQRKSQATMNGTTAHRRDPAGHARPRHLLDARARSRPRSRSPASRTPVPRGRRSARP